MERPNPLEALQNLQRDLVLLVESRIVNIDRLSDELEASIADFQRLLDRKRKNEQSRKIISNVTRKQDGAQSSLVVAIDNTEYEITEDFQNAVITVADELDLDEVEAAKLCIAVQDELDQVDATLPFRAVLRFHNERQTLLDCLRILLKKSADVDEEDEEDIAEYCQSIVRRIVSGKDGQQNGKSAYWRKCIDGLTEIESLVMKAHDQVQAVIMTGRSLDGPSGEALRAQRMFLTHQHEALSAIMSYIIRANHVMPEDFRLFLSKTAAVEAPLDITAHYAPILMCGSAYFGSDSATTEAAAHDLHKLFAAGPGQLQWKSRNLQAAATVWWLVEYSSRFMDHNQIGQKNAKEEDSRTKLFLESLKGKAFHFMLAIADFLKPEVWHDPAKAGLVRFLLDNTIQFPREAVAPSPEFAQLVMQEFQAFTEAFVSHMPDVLRQLKTEEDERRRNLLTASLDGEDTYEMDLERFLLVVAYAYQDDPPAAADFWGDTENNLYGFLRWTSKRLPTPRVAAFCELLRSLANDEKSADHAYRFLLEENNTAVSRSRRAYAVSWAQIFSELELYATSVRNKPAITQISGASRDELGDPDVVETETPIMLEAYLRLVARITRNSQESRNWILRDQPFRLHDILLQLASSSTPPSVQACCFEVLAALLTDRTADVNDGLWVAIDGWISGGGMAGTTASRAQTDRGQRIPHEKGHLQHIAANSEVATAFVTLLNALIAPPRGHTELALDGLPFPEQLGASHRPAGIEAYVDFVMGEVFTLPTLKGHLLDDRMQTSVLRHACLTFAWLCLSTFNEDVVVIANTTNTQVEAAMKTKSLATYVRLHPFARVMEHLFNDNVAVALFATLNQNPDELETLDSHSPLVQATLKGVEVAQFALKLQPTFFDIVRPLIKTQAPQRAPTVANPAITSFDEVLLNHLEIVVYLVHFAACRHVELTLASLDLLQTISSSRKIIGRETGKSNRELLEHRLISKLQDVSEAVQVDLRQDLELQPRDIETGEAPFRLVKAKAVLDLLNASIEASPESPAVAHCLLGFQCHSQRVGIAPESLFSDGKSLFHYIVAAAAALPASQGDNHISWLQATKRACVELLARLASAKLTGQIVLHELRSQDLLPALLASCEMVGQNSLWDGLPAQSSQVLFTSSAITIKDFLLQRKNLFELASRELKAVSESGLSSIRERVISALLGSIIKPDGSREASTSAFALFDFFDLEIAAPMEATTKYFASLNFTACVVNDRDGGSAYDLKMVEQLLVLKKREIWLSGALKDQAEELQVNDEISAIVASFQSQNRSCEIRLASLDAVESWADLAAGMVTSAAIAKADRPAIALQVLQIVLPRFERSLSDSAEAAALLAKLILSLVLAAGDVSTTHPSALAKHSQERLAQVFRACLRAVTDSGTTLAMRDVCYRICCSVVASAPRTKTTGTLSPITKQLLHLVRDNGDRVVSVIAEDAFSGRGVTRVSALLCLDTFLQLFASAKLSSVILRSLTKVNFLPVLVDTSICNISGTFRNTEIDLRTTLAYFHTALALLLRIAQTQDGVQAILNSGFFDAVHESGLFSTDPDIGLDIDNPAALSEFYRLLSSILRVLVAIVVQRGAGDGTTMQSAKRFLTENRISVSAVFKLVNRQDESGKDLEPTARQVADEFGRLMFLTGFLEDDDPSHAKTTRRSGFS